MHTSSSPIRPRALQLGLLAAPLCLLALLVPHVAEAQPLLRDEARLATFSTGALTAISRPTFDGVHAITSDGRCVSGSDVVLPMAVRYAAWAHPASSSFVSAAEPFRVRTALYRNDCTPSSVLLEDFSGLVATTIQAPLLAGSLVQHGTNLDLVEIPAPGGTLTPVRLADGASLAAVLPPIAATEVLRSEVVLGRNNAPGELDTLVFDALRTWYEPTLPAGGETMHQEVWVLEVRPGSAPVVRLGPFPVLGMHALATDVPVRLTVTSSPDHLVIETRRELVLAPRDAVALDPAEVRMRIARDAFRWPGGPGFAGLVPAPSGLVAMYDVGAGQELHRVSIDPALADLDRDGLVAELEGTLGTSDLDRDSDGDDFDDAVEVSLATDPASTSSAPPPLPFEQLAQLAATGYLALEQPRGFGRERCVLGECWGTPGPADIACVREGSGPTEVCLDATDDDSLMLDWFAVPTPDGQFVVEPADRGTSPSTVRWRVRELATGSSREVTPPAGVAFLEAPMPLSGTEVYFTVTNPGTGAPVSLARWLDGEVRIVLELTACRRFVGERECGIRLVGHDRARGRPLAVVWSSDGARVERTWLFVLEESGARYAAELTAAVPDDSTVETIHSLSSGGYVVTSRLVSGLPAPTAARLDPYFRPAGTQTRLMGGGGGPGFGRFRRGYVATDAMIALVLPPPTGNACIDGPGASVCFQSTGGGIPDMPYPVTVIFPLEWRTVDDQLQPGEVIAFSVEPLVTSYGFGLPRNPALFRITRDGAIAAWIDLARFEGLMDEATRAALEGVTLFADVQAPARTIAVSPDRARLCIADGVRTFELLLSDGRPTGVRLADADAGEACAYDEAGQLAVISGSPHVLSVGGATIALPEGLAISELVRVEETWILARAGEPALCVDSAVTETSVRAVGIAPAFGGVVWLDGDGQGHLAPSASRFCSGQASDRLGSDGFDLWGASSGVSGIPGFLRTTNVAMAVRGDGRVTAFPRIGEAANAFPLVLTVSWLPRWEPVDGSGHRPLDGLRRRYDGATQHEGVQVERLAGVSALTYVPGPAWDEDWGYRERPGSPVSAGTTSDAGVARDAGPGAPVPTSSSCICGVARQAAAARPGVLVAALAVLALVARRRRTSSMRVVRAHVRIAG